MKQDESKIDSEKSERKYQVFISSTFRDLADQRRMVMNAVVDRGHMPIALERFPATDNTVPSVINKSIAASQIYIVILGFRYGAIVKDRDISFSHLEYENAINQKRVVVPFLLAKSEVINKRKQLEDEYNTKKVALEKLAPETLGHSSLAREITDIKAELNNEKKLWDFRLTVEQGRFHQPFSLKTESEEADTFDKHMVLKALLEAEKMATERRIPGWIREPADRDLAETLEVVSHNPFLVDVVGAMAKFDKLFPRIRDQADEKKAAARFFADKYLLPLLAKDEKASLFFESGSTLAYVAQVIGEQLQSQRKEITISTNNVLAYQIFWLVHRIRCSLFPWGPPEERYGAVLGPVNDYVPVEKQPFFPPEMLSIEDKKAIQQLQKDANSPARWKRAALLLGALSGFQMTKDTAIADCLGPHVGSPRNKVFKRFMYSTELPLMLFLDSKKIDLPVDPNHCHFVLDQQSDQELPWETFISQRPVAFCVGCKNIPEETEPLITKFEGLGLKIVSARYKTSHTAFIARNNRFISNLESGMNIT
jgi:hypothetical protein